MIRKMTSVLIALLLMVTVLLPVSAEAFSFVADEAGLFSGQETAVLEEKAAALNSTYGIHAVILTVDSLGGTRAQDYADDYYDSTGYGDDGVLFLLAMEEREWYISTTGKMIYALTDYGIQQIGEGSVAFFGEGAWYDGFCYFLDTLPAYLEALENNTPMDGAADYSGSYYHGDQEEIVSYEEAASPSFLLSLFCGIAAAGITVLIMRLCMNTKRPRHSAGEYMVNGSWNLSQHQDLFLYSNVTKTRKQDPPKSSGGGSSVHRSSGGRSHGGGGGKF